MLKLSSTPLVFPSSQQSRQDILEEPTFHATDCDNDSAPSSSSPPLGEVSTEGERGPCFSDDYDQVMTYLPPFIPAEFDLTSELVLSKYCISQVEA